jgi:hypothetical protein
VLKGRYRVSKLRGKATGSILPAEATEFEENEQRMREKQGRRDRRVRSTRCLTLIMIGNSWSHGMSPAPLPFALRQILLKKAVRKLDEHV